MRRYIGMLALVAIAASASPAPAREGWATICIQCSKAPRERTAEEKKLDAERAAKLAAEKAERERVSAMMEAEYKRRRDALKEQWQISEHRSAEMNRIAKMQYDAMIARQRAAGCWVPGDPPDPKRKACATQQ